MNHATMVRRLLWKDYRTYRSLWLAMLLLTAVLQALAVGSGVWNKDPGATLAMLFWVTCGMPIAFAVAVSSVSFSQEHEAGTFDYLRCLPLRPRDLLVARWLHAAMGVAVLFAAVFMLYLCWLLVLGPFVTDPPPRVAWRLTMLALLSIFCGTFFSLILKRPLRAALLTALAISLVGLNETAFRGSGIPLPVAVVVFGAANLGLIHRWFHGNESALPLIFPIPSARSGRRSFRGVVGRMVWLHLRRMGLIYLTIIVAAVGLGILTVSKDLDEPGSPDFVVILACLQVAAGLLGVSVIYVDQRDRGYLFFAEHGVSPTFVWCVRHLVGVGVLVFLAGSNYALARTFSADTHSSVSALAGLPLLAYLSGQLCMLMTRSPIIASFLSVVVTACLGFWCVVNWLFQIPVYIGLLPIVLFWVLASLLRVGRWSLEHDGPRATALPVSIAAVGLFAAVGGIAKFRLDQIPRVDRARLVASTESFATVDQQNAGRLLLDAADNLPTRRAKAESTSIAEYIGDLTFDGSDPNRWEMPTPTPEESAWLEEARPNLAEVRQAYEQSERPAVNAFDPQRMSFRLELTALISLMVAEARQLQSDGQLEEAWERYRRGLDLAMQLRASGLLIGSASADMAEHLIYSNLIWWADEDNQTAAMVISAAEFILRLADTHPTCTVRYKQECMIQVDVIRRAPDSLSQLGMNSDEVQRVAFIYRLMPWERARSIRAIEWHGFENLPELQIYDRAVERNREVTTTLIRSMNNATPDAVVMRSLLAGELATHAYMFSQTDAKSRNRRRAAVWQLSLIAWKHQHGAYPESLDEVREQSDLTLLDDIYTGRPFVYHPHGRPCRVAVAQADPLSSYVVSYPPGHPFLWSPSLAAHQAIELNPQDPASYALRNRFVDTRSVNDLSKEEILWWSGDVFGLP